MTWSGPSFSSSPPPPAITVAMTVSAINARTRPVSFTKHFLDRHVRALMIGRPFRATALSKSFAGAQWALQQRKRRTLARPPPRMATQRKLRYLRRNDRDASRFDAHHRDSFQCASALRDGDSNNFTFTVV